MNSQACRKRIQWSVGALGAAALLIAFFRLARTQPDETARGDAVAIATPAPATPKRLRAEAAATVADEEEVRASRPLPDCWTGLDRTQAALSVSELRAAAAPLLSAQPRDEL